MSFSKRCKKEILKKKKMGKKESRKVKIKKGLGNVCRKMSN